MEPLDLQVIGKAVARLSEGCLGVTMVAGQVKAARQRNPCLRQVRRTALVILKLGACGAELPQFDVAGHQLDESRSANIGALVGKAALRRPVCHGQCFLGSTFPGEHC